jgi:hypothetical protein
MLAARQAGLTLELLNSEGSETAVPGDSSSPPSGDSNIWQIWLQGWAKVPPVVAAVSAVNKKANPGLQFRQLDFDEAAHAVGLSRDMRRLYEEGRVSKTGIADLLRLRLIAQHGGIWLDATVLVSPALTSMAQNSKNFFLLSDRDWKSMAPHHFAVANWAFGASANNHFVKSWADLLEAHWLRQGQKHYFDAVYCATALIRSGVFPLSDIDRTESLRIQHAASALMDCWLEDDGSDNAMDVYYSNPMHKLSYKTSAREADQLVNFLSRITSGLGARER